MLSNFIRNRKEAVEPADEYKLSVGVKVKRSDSPDSDEFVQSVMDGLRRAYNAANAKLKRRTRRQADGEPKIIVSAHRSL